MMFPTISVLILMLTMVPTTSLVSLTIRAQAYPQLFNPGHREVTMLSDLRIKVVTAVVGSILLSSPTPSFAESAASKDMASITSLNKVNRPVMSKQTSESVLSDRVDKIESNIIEINEKIEDLRRDATVVFVVASILFVVRSEVKDGQMKKEMKRNKEEADAKMAKADAKMDKNKEEADAKMAKADAKMDRNFIITSGISAGSLLVSLVMTLAAKK